jgi:hypothetical protein
MILTRCAPTWAAATVTRWRKRNSQVVPANETNAHGLLEWAAHTFNHAGYGETRCIQLRRLGESSATPTTTSCSSARWSCGSHTWSLSPSRCIRPRSSSRGVFAYRTTPTLVVDGRGRATLCMMHESGSPTRACSEYICPGRQLFELPSAVWSVIRRAVTTAPSSCLSAPARRSISR